MIRLELRAKVSNRMVYCSPIFAVIMTLASGVLIFNLLGVNPTQAIITFFIEPISSIYGIAELCVKATPLVLIAIGLSFCFKANIWNIGAEGQLTIGALAGGGLGLLFFNSNSQFLMPAMLIFGILGGMFWASIPAFLKTRFGTNEILTSLMLTYIALLILSYLIHGPWKDPDGQNFPESRLFQDAALLPIIMNESRLHLGWVVALLCVPIAWIVITYHVIGFQIRVLGMAPMASKFAGFKDKQIIWSSFLISGGMAGIAGIIEVSGPIGQIIPVISPGYGFTAIIVAFLGRLHPLGCLIAGLLMALTYLGGDNAQIELNLPNAVTGVFQGMLLFFLLASDVLARYRIRTRSYDRNTK
tara:strand:- start:3397 stop:4470 length:1074 start_codon:yes stop_codon:yes gene_type:complete